MSRFNWKASADRLRALAKRIEAERENIWEKSDDLGFDRSLSKCSEELEFMASQIDVQKCGKAA